MFLRVVAGMPLKTKTMFMFASNMLIARATSNRMCPESEVAAVMFLLVVYGLQSNI